MPALKAGTIAPHIALENVESGERTSPAYEAWTLIAFYKVTCPTCQLAMPYVEAFGAYAPGGLEVLAVVEDSAAEACTFRSEYGSTVVTVSDPPPYSVSSAYGLTNVPTLFLLEPGARIARVQVGFSKEAYNEIAAEIAHRLGVPPVEVCPADDGAPAVKPG